MGRTRGQRTSSGLVENISHFRFVDRKCAEPSIGLDLQDVQVDSAHAGLGQEISDVGHRDVDGDAFAGGKAPTDIDQIDQFFDRQKLARLELPFGGQA